MALKTLFNIVESWFFFFYFDVCVVFYDGQMDQ